MSSKDVVQKINDLIAELVDMDTFSRSEAIENMEELEEQAHVIRQGMKEDQAREDEAENFVD